MQTKRIIAYAAAFATSVSMFSVSASAASSKLKLLTAPVTDINNEAFDVSAMYDDDLYCTVSEGFVKSFFTVDTAAWRKSGELSFSDVNVDGEVDFDKLGYMNDEQMLCNESEGRISRRYAYDFNGSDTMEITYQSEDWFFCSDDGTIIKDSKEPGKFGVEMISPEGESTRVLFEEGLDPSHEAYNCWLTPINDDVHAAYVFIEKGAENEGDYYNISAEFQLVNKDGTSEKIWEHEICGYSLVGIDNKDLVIGYTNSPAKGLSFVKYDLETGTFTDTYFSGLINPFFRNSEGSTRMAVEGHAYGYNMNNIYKLSDDRYVAEYIYNGSVDEVKEFSDTAYRLLDGDLNTLDNWDCYKDMGWHNSDIILVQTADDKWGYINTDGELLATFDDASEFKGKYAPVVKDGKAFLINKDMKRVSEKIDADGVYTLDKDLFSVLVDDEVFLMTYAVEGKSAESDDTASSDDEKAGLVTEEPADVPEKTGETTTDTAKDDSKANPDTGAASAAVVIGLTTVAGGILLLSRKRR